MVVACNFCNDLRVSDEYYEIVFAPKLVISKLLPLFF